MSSPKVIKIYGRAKVAHLDGERFDREDVIFVPSEKNWFYTLPYDNHFVYRQRRKIGSSLLCTCGGAGGIFPYNTYMKYHSTNMGRVVCCVSQINTGFHADGST